MSEVEKVRCYFNRASSVFDSLYSEREMGPLMRFINRHFRSDIYERFVLTMAHVRRHGLQSVLDVGCGSGRYEVGFLELGVRRILGIDISQDMINLAVRHTSQHGGEGQEIELLCSDFAAFRTTEIFDVAVAMGFFDYVSDPVVLLRRMKELARHSVIASFPSISFYRTPIRKVRYYFKKCPVYFYRREDIASLARDAGFASCEITKIKGAGMDYVAAFYE